MTSYSTGSLQTESNLAISYLPWIEKYRPSSLDEIVSHNTIIQTLKNSIEKNSLQHLLFHGPPGSGKTSCIMACARKLYGKKLDLMTLSINASEDRGIEVVRNKIQRFVSTKNIFSDDNMYKLVILDEADAMTADAQAILRKVIENYSNTVRFCLICNYSKKITPALQSRCACYRFPPHDGPSIKLKLNQIANNEKITLTEDGINTIIKIANGDMRRAINILQSTSTSYDSVSAQTVIKCTGYINPQHIDQIYSSLLNDSFNKSHDIIFQIKKKYSYTLNDIITELVTILTNHIQNIQDFKTTGPVQGTVQNNKNIIIPSENAILLILTKLCDIEFNLTSCTSENIQTDALIGVFKNI